jgi:hypothetical protein
MPLARLHELRSQIEALLTQLRSIHAQALAISSQFPGWYAHHLKETASRHEAELNRLQEEFARKWSGLMVGVNTLNPYVAGTGIEWRISANERTRLSTLIRDGSDLPSTTIDADTPMMVIARSYHRAIKAVHENLEAIRSENLKEIATARQEFERKQYELQRLRDASLEALETEHSKQVETIGVEIDKRKSSWEQKRDDECQEAARSYEKEISEAKAAMIVSLTHLNAEQEKALAHLAQENDMALKALAAQKEELIGKLQRLRRSSLRLPLYQRPWTDADWQPFHPATTLPTDGRLRIGRQFVSTPVGKVEIPLMVPFLGDSHLWVDIDEPNRDQFMKFIASLVLRLYTSTAPGNLSVLLFDPSELGTRFTEYTSLLPAQLFKVTNDPHELDDELRRLTKAAFDKQRAFGDRAPQSGRLGNRAYNVILLNDFPRRIDNRLLDSLEEIANAGHLRGLHIIGLIGKERLQKDQERNPTLLGNQITIHGQEIGFLRTARTDRASLTMPSGNTKGFQQRELRLDIPYNKEFPSRILEAIRSQYESPRDVPRGFLEHLPDKSEVGQEGSSEALRTPIGVAVPNSSSLVNIEFDSEQSVHAFILGSTGRGKSTLLTELITGLAIRYSPAELALMLLDDKEGVEFERWRVLPHVKILKLGRDTNSALAVVEDLEKELKRRGDAFRNKRVRSISEYRHQYPSEPMPRILMIWDQ